MKKEIIRLSVQISKADKDIVDSLSEILEENKSQVVKRAINLLNYKKSDYINKETKFKK